MKILEMLAGTGSQKIQLEEGYTRTFKERVKKVSKKVGEFLKGNGPVAKITEVVNSFAKNDQSSLSDEELVKAREEALAEIRGHSTNDEFNKLIEDIRTGNYTSNDGSEDSLAKKIIRCKQIISITAANLTEQLSNSNLTPEERKTLEDSRDDLIGKKDENGKIIRDGRLIVTLKEAVASIYDAPKEVVAELDQWDDLDEPLEPGIPVPLQIIGGHKVNPEDVPEVDQKPIEEEIEVGNPSDVTVTLTAEDEPKPEEVTSESEEEPTEKEAVPEEAEVSYETEDEPIEKEAAPEEAEVSYETEDEPKPEEVTPESEEETIEIAEDVKVSLDDLTAFDSYEEYVTAYFTTKKLSQSELAFLAARIVCGKTERDMLTEVEFSEKRQKQIDKKVIDELHDELDAKQRRISALESAREKDAEDLAALRDRVTSLSDQVEKLREKNTSLSDANIVDQRTIKNLEEQVADLEAKLKAAGEARDEYQASGIAKGKTIAAQVVTIERLEEKARKLAAKLEESNKDLEAAREAARKEAERVSAMTDNITEQLKSVRSGEESAHTEPQETPKSKAKHMRQAPKHMKKVEEKVEEPTPEIELPSVPKQEEPKVEEVVAAPVVPAITEEDPQPVPEKEPVIGWSTNQDQDGAYSGPIVETEDGVEIRFPSSETKETHKTPTLADIIEEAKKAR